MRRIPLVIAALALSSSAQAWQDSKSPWVFDLPLGGSNCTLLPEAANPIRYDVSFEGDIRPIIGTVCSPCHIASSSGGMNINFSNARTNLIGAAETGAPANGDPTRLRVRPGVPTDSVIFLKINCATPPFGGQMPPGGPATTQLQALMHDWIAAGALMPDNPGGERTFVGNFESITRPVPPPLAPLR